MPKSKRRTRRTIRGVPENGLEKQVVAAEPVPPAIPETRVPEDIPEPPGGPGAPTAPIIDQGLAVERPVALLTPRLLSRSVTVEASFYALVLVAAVSMRFAGLDGRPLAQHEASIALAAWQFLRGGAVNANGSPFLFSSDLLLFLLGGATDAAARIAPALFGSTVVLLPVLLRREIGRAGALVSSLLLLLSTTLTYFARDLNGVEISALAGTAACIWLWRYAGEGHSRALYLASIAGAIALTASSAGFTILLSGLLFVLVFRLLKRRSPDLPGSDLYDHSNGSGLNGNAIDNRAEWRNAVLLFGAVYVVVSTAFLMNRAGLGISLNLLGEWLGQFQQIGPLVFPFEVLLIYEPLALVFGLAGLMLIPGVTDERSRGILLFLGCTAITGLIVYSLAGVKFAGNVVVVVIPLVLLAGWFIGSILERGTEELVLQGGWRAVLLGELPVTVMAFVLTCLVYLQLVDFLQQNRFSPGIEGFHQVLAPGSPTAFEPAALLLGIITLAVVAVLALLSVGTIGASRTANLAAVLVAILLAVSGVRALWLANYPGGDTVHELLSGDQTSLQARDLLHDLEWQSEWRSNDQHTIAIATEEGLGPVVGWYLRSFPNLKSVPAAQAGGDVQALVTAADAPAPVGTWISQLYRIQMNWQLQEMTRAGLFKWLIGREGGTETWTSVKLWVPKPE